jgi:hypothetical protein
MAMKTTSLMPSDCPATVSSSRMTAAIQTL